MFTIIAQKTTTLGSAATTSRIIERKKGRASSLIIARAEPAKPQLKKAEDFTAGGGGARGYCDVEEIKNAIKECEGLEGKKLEACYAQYGCDINIVTDHYAKVAGVEKKSQDEK